MVQTLQRGKEALVIDGYNNATADVYNDAIKVRGQPNLKRRQAQRLQRGFSGNITDTVGSLICRTEDLEEDGWAPKIGDRIVKIAELDVRYIIEEVRHETLTPPLAAGRMAERHEVVYCELVRDDRRQQSEQR